MKVPQGSVSKKKEEEKKYSGQSPQRVEIDSH